MDGATQQYERDTPDEGDMPTPGLESKAWAFPNDETLAREIKNWYADYDGNISKHDADKYLDLVKSLKGAWENGSNIKLIFNNTMAYDCVISEPPRYIMDITKFKILRVVNGEYVFQTIRLSLIDKVEVVVLK